MSTRNCGEGVNRARLAEGRNGRRAAVAPPTLREAAFGSTTQIPADLGRASVETIVLAVNYTELWLGMRMQARVESMRELYASTCTRGLLVSVLAGIRVTHAGAFCKLTGVTP